MDAHVGLIGTVHTLGRYVRMMIMMNDGLKESRLPVFIGCDMCSLPFQQPTLVRVAR